MATGRGEQLTKILKDLEISTPEIEGSAVISTDGLVMASAFHADIEEDRVAAMSAAMLSLGERTAGELGRGKLDQVYIKGEGGYVFLMSAGVDAVLTALAREDAKLGIIFLEMKRTAEEIEAIKKLCDRYYQNPPVTEEEICNARIQEIYIIDVDQVKVQEIDPEAYMKHTFKGLVFDYTVLNL